ncbi:hypothetical protein HYALB_00001417 [Hymenoscyphus albidus]|uniref:Large ribosomal subunit protein mL44 n=1 Tax=Hymenoscyphus albidus TaxID=595503 RepID=A0A9N9Q2P6_9HELO|nr:hypothetical protein HYALB_00001417 [Hymenoscyphus albidus]
MKRLRPERWGGQLLTAPRRTTSRGASRCLRQQQCLARSLPRAFSSSATHFTAASKHEEIEYEDGEIETIEEDVKSPSKSPTPAFIPPHPNKTSSKLGALHARLRLPPLLPQETLARTLIDPSANSKSDCNNATLAQLGGSIIAFHVSEWLLVTYPRLPMTVLFAASYAYSGPKTLQLIGKEWGVETAAAPGNEVDPGFLQFKKLAPGTELAGGGPTDRHAATRRDKAYFRRGVSSRVVYDDEFGDIIPKKDNRNASVPTEEAYASFVKAVVGAIQLHAGREEAKAFVKDHILSRHLAINSLFQFQEPVRELSRLCAREGFEHPIARILSETGRLSRHPVFVVGIFSGKDKLGEGSGASLLEARTRAAVATLKSWYLYSPGQDARVPSDMEDETKKHEKWEPVHIDMGEVIH